jgi:hypothetical protein
MKQYILILLFCLFSSAFAQSTFFNQKLDSIPTDMPIPIITKSNNPSSGYIFASVPYWGSGNHYIVIYNSQGKPVFFKKTKSLCTDFKLHENKLLTYFDYDSKKYYAMDTLMNVVDSFWVQNGFTTDEHDIKFMNNGNVLLIGLDIKTVDMSKYVNGGSRSARVVVNVIQEITPQKNVVFEWKSDEHYKYTDAADRVNLLDLSFVHSHINSIDIDGDENLIVSARNLNEITKIDRKTGNIIWRFGGKNNQFKFVNDTLKFSAQHSAVKLKNGNMLLYDNGLEHVPQNARAVEYMLDEENKTATVVWLYKNQPSIISNFWGNAQRLDNGNTFIAWGFNKIAATEVNSNNEIVFEMEFPADVYSYRLFKFDINVDNIVSVNNYDDEKKYEILSQNFPNPFNPITTIKYSIPGNVEKLHATSLRVYDVLGREVAVLVNQKKTAGRYEINFDGSKFPSGVYFYKLNAGQYSDSKKMILVK